MGINRVQESGEKHLKTVFRLPHTGKVYSVEVAVSQTEQKKIQVVFGMSPKAEDHIGLEMVAASSNKFQICLIDGRSVRGPTLEAVVDQSVRPTSVRVSYKKSDKSEPKVLISSELTKVSQESYVMNSHILESMLVSSLTKLATSGIHQEYLFEGALSNRTPQSIEAISVKFGSPLYIRVHLGKNQPKSYAVSLGVDKWSKIVARVDMITTNKNRPVVGLTTTVETSRLLTSQVDYDMDELSHIKQMLQAFMEEHVPTIKEKIHDITKMIISDAKEVYPNLQKSIEELMKLVEVILEDPTFKHFRALIEESLICVMQSVEDIWKWLIETLEKLKYKIIELLSKLEANLKDLIEKTTKYIWQLVKKIEAALPKIKKWLKEKVLPIVDEILDKIIELVEKLKKFIDDLLNIDIDSMIASLKLRMDKVVVAVKSGDACQVLATIFDIRNLRVKENVCVVTKLVIDEVSHLVHVVKSTEIVQLALHKKYLDVAERVMFIVAPGNSGVLVGRKHAIVSIPLSTAVMNVMQAPLHVGYPKEQSFMNVALTENTIRTARGQNISLPSSHCEYFIIKAHSHNESSLTIQNVGNSQLSLKYIMPGAVIRHIVSAQKTYMNGEELVGWIPHFAALEHAVISEDTLMMTIERIIKYACEVSSNEMWASLCPVNVISRVRLSKPSGQIPSDSAGLAFHVFPAHPTPEQVKAAMREHRVDPNCV